MKRGKRAGGFTLIEMIVALVISSMLAVVVVSGLYLGIRSWQAVTGRIDSNSDAAVSVHALRQILEAAEYTYIRDTNGERQTAFYGEVDRMIFVAPTDPLDEDRLYWIMVSVEELDSGAKTLVLHREHFETQDYLDEELEFEEPNPLHNVDWQQRVDELQQLSSTPLFRVPGFNGVRFEYLRIEPDELPRWETEWEVEPYLPVTIKLEFDTGPDVEWPELYIQPKVKAYEFKQLL